MKSWEVLRDAVEKVGVKGLAAKLNLSAALVYKWCQSPAQDDPDASGARNPLDRVKLIYDVTQDAGIVNWLCHEAGGFYVRNPEVRPHEIEEHLLGTTQRIVKEFGDMLGEVSKSIANDGRITSEEAERIRQAWEKLKTTAECMVVACERGLYKQL